MMGTFSVSSCPVCDNWHIEDHYGTPRGEVEEWVKEHLYECFGLTEIMEDLPWSA